MSSRQHQSPVLMEQSVSPPHLLSPELNPTATMPPPATSEAPQPQPSEAVLEPEPESGRQASIQQPETESPSTLQASPAVSTEPASEATAAAQTTTEPTNTVEEVNQNSEPSSTVEDNEVPLVSQNNRVEATSDEPHAATENSGNSEQPAEIAEPTEPTESTETAAEPVTENAEDADRPPTPPVPAAASPPQEAEEDEEVIDNTPSWVQYEEDASLPDEDELKEIEESELERLDAGDIAAMEKHFFPDNGDPEQRPFKKLRMSWVIEGIRGTRQKPNMAKVMNSPAVCIDGLYWSIKFYPRGDNCASLSAFVRCARVPPRQHEEMPAHNFAFYEGSPETDFTTSHEPVVTVSMPNTQKVREETKTVKKSTVADGSKRTSGDRESSNERPWTPLPDDDEFNESSDGSENSDVKNWRVSAQLGMTIYNPAEPRTNHYQSDGHQFSKACDDWGWVSFVGPWDGIHKRKRGQRKPLLQNDTLAIDAYVLIYEDPTEALWWHESKDEQQWPSKELAGFHPMGTPALYHSAAVAGITAWTILAPFRKIMQVHDTHKWRTDSMAVPTPLVAQTQLVLQQMRLLGEECYVNVFKVIEELMEADESWEDVKSFWEVYRRALDLELTGDDAALRSMSDIFDAGGKTFDMPSIPVESSESVFSGLSKHFEKTQFKGPLPNFLPVMLERQHFDREKREWKLHQDRIQLTDDLDLSPWCTDGDAHYTLYGFIVHVGVRNSIKFYSVLRPGGIGSKWLAFEDGNGNKVYSYTKKRIQEFEGLEGAELKDFSGEREKAYMAMYVRTSCFSDYLPRQMEDWNLPLWLRRWAREPVDVSDVQEKEEAKQKEELERQRELEGTKVQICLDESVAGQENMLEIHELRCASERRDCSQTIMVAIDKTFADLRAKIAEALGVTDPNKVALWELSYRGLGRASGARLENVSWRRKVKKRAAPGEILHIWLTILPHEGKKESYKSLLPKIAEVGLDKKTPQPEPPVPDSTATEVEKSNIEGSASMTGDSPGADQLVEDTNTQRADTSSSHTEDSTTTGIATPATGDTGDSAQDAEQASIEAAVAADVDHVDQGNDIVRLRAASESGQTQNSAEAATFSVSTTPVAGENPDDDLSATPIPDTPLEHNHLVEAARAPEPVEVASTAQENVTGGLEPTPDDEISAEDAAAIAAVLAADAAEQAATQAAELEDTEPQQNNSSHVDEQPEAATSPVFEAEVVQARSPSPDFRSVYGFLYVFDAEGQKFVAQSPINPEIEQEIGTYVRQALGWSEDKEVRIWKRDGPAGTSPITNSCNFNGDHFHDGFVLIAAEVISESKNEELKQAGKFWQPAHLIKYLNMQQRRHPILSVTSSEPTTMADFGQNYFKGPIVNGQPHGKDCLLITASGHIYEGSMAAGMKSGQGKMTERNGDVYVGGWLNDEKHGQGELVEARTGNRYVGGFENGKKWGAGVTTWKVADEQAKMCQICYGEEIDALFFDCGHVCACVECAERQRDNGCPICRKPVQQVVKMFWA